MTISDVTDKHALDNVLNEIAQSEAQGRLKERTSSSGLRVKATFNELVKEDSEDGDDEEQYLQKRVGSTMTA